MSRQYARGRMIFPARTERRYARRTITRGWLIVAALTGLLAWNATIPEAWWAL